MSTFHLFDTSTQPDPTTIEVVEAESPEAALAWLAERWDTTPEELWWVGVEDIAVWVARSDEEEYLRLKRLVADGQMVVEGERFLEGGVVETVFRFVDEAQANPEVGFDPSYFVNVTRDYRNWRLKWWREAIQNSVDAGAKNVELNTVFDDETGEWHVGVLDDGKGMDRETLTEKFLKMGGTGKAVRAGQVGGFGEAKKLLAFPWVKWFLHTRDLHVIGRGSHYDIEPAPSYLDGTELIVTMPGDMTTGPSAAMEFLQRSSIPGVRFYVDGERFRAGGLRRGKLVKSYDFGELYHNKSAKQGKLYVRANGIFMFTADTFDPKYGTLILELTGDTTELLMSNREKLRNWRHEEALRQFVAEIYTEGERALKKKEKLFTEVWKGTGRISTDQGMTDVLDSVGPLPETDARGLIVSKSSAADIGATLEQLVAVLAVTQGNLTLKPATPEVVGEIVHEPLKGAKDFEALAQQLVWTPDWMLHNEVRGLNIPARFRPEGMTGRIVALAQVWAEACRWVLIQLGHRAEYGVGFVFDETALAMCMEREGVYWLLLNPLRSLEPLADRSIPGGYILRKSDRDDMKALYARAIHECTHMDSGYFRHDAAFSSALTNNFAKCADGFKVMWRIAKTIKAPKVKALKRKPRPSLINPIIRAAMIDPKEGVTELLLHDHTGDARAWGSELAGAALWSDTVTLRSPTACNMVVGGHVRDEAARERLFSGDEVTITLSTRLLADLHVLQEVKGCYTAELDVVATRFPDGGVKVEVDMTKEWTSPTMVYAAELSRRALWEPYGVELGPVFIDENSSTYDELTQALPELDRSNIVYGQLSASQLVTWFRAELARRDPEEEDDWEIDTETEWMDVVASAGPTYVPAEDPLVSVTTLKLTDPTSRITYWLAQQGWVVGQLDTTRLRDPDAIDLLVQSYLGKPKFDRVLDGLVETFRMPQKLFAYLLVMKALDEYPFDLRVLVRPLTPDQEEAGVRLDDEHVPTKIFVLEMSEFLKGRGHEELAEAASQSLDWPMEIPLHSQGFDELEGLMLDPSEPHPVALVPAGMWLEWLNTYWTPVDKG